MLAHCNQNHHNEMHLDVDIDGIQSLCHKNLDLYLFLCHDFDFGLGLGHLGPDLPYLFLVPYFDFCSSFVEHFPCPYPYFAGSWSILLHFCPNSVQRFVYSLPMDLLCTVVKIYRLFCLHVYIYVFFQCFVQYLCLLF